MMKISNKSMKLGLVAFVILSSLLILLRMENSRLFGRSDSVIRSTVDRHNDQELNGSPPRKRNRDQENAYVDPRVKRYLDEDKYLIKIDRLSEYLFRHQRDPGSLVAAFLLTRDQAILEELRTHLDNSEAVMCLLQASSSFEEKKKLVDIYIRLNPNDMTGYLLNASLLSKNEGTKQQQLALIMKGITSADFSGGFGDTNAALTEALLSTGMSTIDAQIYLSTNANETGRLFYTCLQMLTSGSELAISAATTAQDKKSEAVKFLSVADSFMEISPYSFENGKPFYYTAVLKMLKQLPDDMVLDEYGISVSEYREKIHLESRDLANERSLVTLLIGKSSPTQVDQFFEMRQNEGFEAANRWLIDSNRK